MNILYSCICGPGRLESWSPWIPGSRRSGTRTWNLELQKNAQSPAFLRGIVSITLLPPAGPKACHRTGHDVSSTALQWQSDRSGHPVQPLPPSICRSAFMLVSTPKHKLGVSDCWRAAQSASHETGHVRSSTERPCRSSRPASAVKPLPLSFHACANSKGRAWCLGLLSCRTVGITSKCTLLCSQSNPSKAVSRGPGSAASCSTLKHVEMAQSTEFHVFECSPRLLFPCSWCGDSEKGPRQRRNDMPP